MFSEWLGDIVLIWYALAGHIPIVYRIVLARAASRRGWRAREDGEVDATIEGYL